MIRNFNQKPFKIKKTGVVYPVDVELKNENGRDVLYISADICFLDLTADGSSSSDSWRQAVLDGFTQWSGDYKVFGDQPLTVKVNVQLTNQYTDCIYVVYIDEETCAEMRDAYGELNLKKLERLFEQRRSFANVSFMGISWKAFLPRFICLLPRNMEDLEYAATTAKHEFGHVLGLGDLYRDLENGLCGVEGAQYSDIAKYYMGNSFFNMVMCNNGPVRDNDIEMVLLAFQTNRFQNYQKVKKRDKVSEALGKGN